MVDFIGLRRECCWEGCGGVVWVCEKAGCTGTHPSCRGASHGHSCRPAGPPCGSARREGGGEGGWLEMAHQRAWGEVLSTFLGLPGPPVNIQRPTACIKIHMHASGSGRAEPHCRSRAYLVVLRPRACHDVCALCRYMHASLGLVPNVIFEMPHLGFYFGALAAVRWTSSSGGCLGFKLCDQRPLQIRLRLAGNEEFALVPCA